MNKKKLKRFWNKFRFPIIVVVLLIVFVVLSTLIGSKVEKDEVDNWIEETKKEQYVVTMFSQTTCSHCIAFKPVINEVVEEYGDNFVFKIFEIDTITTALRNKLISAYDIDFIGTPHLFVTYGGELVDSFDDNEYDRTEEDVVRFLKDKGVLE